MRSAHVDRGNPVAEWWRVLEDGALCVQCCETCGRHQFPVGVVCRCCGGDELSWSELTDTGQIVARTRLERLLPGFGDEPYTVVMARFRDDVVVLGRFVDEGTVPIVGAACTAEPLADGRGIAIRPASVGGGQRG